VEPNKCYRVGALRALKRRLSDVVYRQLMADGRKASPGGHSGATTTSSAADPTPKVGSPDKSLPGLDTEPTPPVHDNEHDHTVIDAAESDAAESASSVAVPRQRTHDTRSPRTTGQTRSIRTPSRRSKL
jgi:hypothetical protein